MWARALGLLFAVPAGYFAARGYINSALSKRLGLLFLMGESRSVGAVPPSPRPRTAPLCASLYICQPLVLSRSLVSRSMSLSTHSPHGLAYSFSSAPLSSHLLPPLFSFGV